MAFLLPLASAGNHVISEKTQMRLMRKPEIAIFFVFCIGNIVNEVQFFYNINGCI